MRKIEEEITEVDALRFLIANAIINNLNAEETAVYLIKAGYRKNDKE